ncbi:MAG TPA: hypothetical protein VMY99_03320 [Nevskiaceae bacterium]|nr:hypothetical protein [Nevskiaceae bacterium]
MAIILHVAIALSSISYATVAFFQPSTVKLRISYGLVTATVASGTFLLVAAPSHMIESCTVGLLYLGIVVALTFSARHKLARVTNK